MIKVKNIFNIEMPILLAPMAGAADSAMAIGVARAGGLGSIACAMLTEDQIKNEVKTFREACPDRPLNLNFFCHENVKPTKAQENAWLAVLATYYQEFKIPFKESPAFVERRSFDESLCQLIEELHPEIVSFHFGLPTPNLVERLKNKGIKIISSATTLEEALWLEERGCDAIIAQGFEAGGHRGMFLSTDVSTQIGTFALVPLIADKVKIPVIAAGGITDGRGLLAALVLGASAVQLGSAYLLSNESKISPVHKAILKSKESHETVITNLFTGKPARSVMNKLVRELGAISPSVPPFPYAGVALAPLKAIAEKQGSGDFMSLWCGQGIGHLSEGISAEELTRKIYSEAKILSSGQGLI